MIEKSTVAENNYPPPLFLPVYSDVIKIRTMNMNQTRKRYFDSPCSNILITGQLKRMMPRAKKKIQISLTIDEYYNKKSNNI
jgi:hypothetical protein